MSGAERRFVVARFRGLRSWWLIRACEDAEEAKRCMRTMKRAFVPLDRRRKSSAVLRVVDRDGWRKLLGKPPLDVGQASSVRSRRASHR